MTSLRVALEFVLLVSLGIAVGCGDKVDTNGHSNESPLRNPAATPKPVPKPESKIEPKPTPDPAAEPEPEPAPKSEAPVPSLPQELPTVPPAVQDVQGSAPSVADDVDAYGFDSKGIYVATGATRDPFGFNKNGIDEEHYDRRGFNAKGFKKSGIHRDTKTKYNLDGYDMDGYDVNGFNCEKIHKVTGTFYDNKGYNKEGYTKRGFGRNGLHFDTGTHYDNNNLNKDGYTIDGYNYEGFNQSGEDRLRKKSFYFRAEDLIKKLGEPTRVDKSDALLLLQEMGSGFGFRDTSLRSLFAKLALRCGVDQCVQKREAVFAATRGKGFPENLDRDRCGEVNRILVGLYEIAK